MEEKKKNRKIKKYLLVVWPMVVVILISILFIICMGSGIAAIYLSAYLVPEELKGNIVAIYLMQYINIESIDVMPFEVMLQSVWIIVFYLWYRRLVKTSPQSRTKFLQWKNLGLIILLAIGNNILISGAMDLVMPYLGKIGDDYIGMMDELFKGSKVLIFISTLILAPISEELICRGVILKKAREAFPFLVANIIQALLFGLMHGNLIQGTYAFVLGLSLGYVTYKFETIIPAMLIHLIMNLLGSYLLLSVPTFAQIIEVILGIGIILFTIRILSKRNPNESTLGI